ncbi:uncharacterized protein N7484_002262 [Penicillium longicatenatum]|uniref:uncharacterized protein n=1 Tax=Penicillium longicatenatum TaxID=1561947 RepID=UPI002547738A|nr:uncharacterized protein N7484_002262 [Penicillium longicatenatum]KAJ5658613.1 hypothetical protein N7484_002262 [Penicillium longicatenatum]
MGFYPKARQQRLGINHPTVRPLRLAVLKAAVINLLVLQLLFLGLFCYIFGSLFQQTTHVHNINILFVDYDGGAIGTAVRDAYQKLKGPGFPTLMEQSTLAFPQPDLTVEAVCNIKYWAALYTAPNATNRLLAALGGGLAASSYNSSDVFTMVWNEARYPTVVDSAVSESLTSLSQAARVAYFEEDGKRLLQTVNSSDSAAIAAFVDPWTLASLDIQTTKQGSRLIYNTLVIILILIQEFFYLGFINGLYQQFKLYTAISPHRIVIVRQIISGLYTLAGSLSTAGAIWAFRHGWHVNGNQFVLTWMTLWLFAHLNFLVLDVFSIWLPPPLLPMALISWVVLNVTSILLPFELSPAFYKVGYALPAHSVFQVLIDIWSGGCNPQLDYALPVLFAYEVVSIVLSSIGVYRRAHYGVIKQEAEEKSLQQRIEAAVAEKQAQETRQDALEGETPLNEPEEGAAMQRRGTVNTLEEKEELVGIIRRELSRPAERAESSRENTGPSFYLPYKQ